MNIRSIHFLGARLLLLCAITSFASCGGGGGGGTQTSFLIASSKPAINALGVPLDVVATVTFNSRLDPSTVTTTTLVVTPLAGGTPILGTTALVADGTDLTVRWTALELLAEDAHYLCSVSGALRDLVGGAIAPPSSYRFSTTPDPSLLDIPAQGDLLALPGRMQRGRQAHAAILLNDNRVLVTGGYTIGLSVTDTAEAFNPSAGVFSLLPTTLVQARAGHTMTKLGDGRILLCGGYVPAGLGQVTTTASAEVFDPSTGQFGAVGDMTTSRADHAAVRLPNGTVLVTGGSRLVGGFLEDLATAEVFDPTTGLFSAHPSPMLHTRATHGMIEVGIGKYVLGGGSDLDFRASVFSVAGNAFLGLAPAASDGSRFGAMLERFDSGGVVIAGGDTLGTVLYVPPGQALVRNTGSALRLPRAYGTATRIDTDRIFVVGGLDFSRGGFIEASADVIIEGGLGGSRTFATPVRFLTGMAFHTATVLADDRVLYCGGVNENGALSSLDRAYLLTP